VRIVILGAGGFIGSHLVEHLQYDDRTQVLALDVTDEKLESIPRDTFVFHQADIRRTPEVLDAVVGEADVVVDLIAYANPSIYVTSPIEVFELNFMQNLRVAEVCMKHRKRLIQYSSAEVYGKADRGQLYTEEETDLVHGPVNKQRWIYASAKMLLERVLFAHGEAGDLDYTIVRPFNFVGSRFDYLVPAGSMGGPRVFAHFMSALLTGGPMYLVDGGRVHRAFMHISDANAAFQVFLDRPEETRNQIFNVGNPDNNVTIREAASLMIDLYQELTGEVHTSEIKEVSGEEFYGQGYEDADRLPPDISKMRRLGWAPKRDIRTTFRDAMSYYLDRRDLIVVDSLAGSHEVVGSATKGS